MRRDWFSSFNDAATGLVRATRTQRNLRYHLLFAFLAIVLSLFANITRGEFLVITLAIGMVIVVELMNSALEEVVDLATEHYHPLAKKVKDTAAGAVLVAAAAALVCGYLVLAPKLEGRLLSAVNYVEKGSEYVTALTLLGVVTLVIAGKASFGKGQVLRGGMPSGHSAVAFSIATAVTFITESFFVSALTVFLALMVAQSRLAYRIHTLREVVVGALLGVLATVLVFQLIR